jgi:hypothetical protein
MRMLFQPLGDGTFHRACEADSFRGLVAAMLDDPTYESGDIETRLVNRLRLADELVLLARIENQPGMLIGDKDADQTINVASDERFIRSLDRLSLASLDPALRDRV